MKLILLEDVDKLGKRGAVVTVKDGYGRNFLLPRKLATHATEGNMKQVAVENKKVELKEAKDAKDASVVKSEIENISLTIPVKAGESDVLFGSVTSSDVAAALEKKGVTVDKRRIELEPIKRLGDYQVPIKLHKNVVAELKVSVIKE